MGRPDPQIAAACACRSVRDARTEGAGWELGFAPAIALQKRISQAAFFTGLMIYLEGVAALALLTEKVLAVPVLIPIVLVMGAKFHVVRRPVRLLVRDRLVASYRQCLLVALVFVALLGLGSRNEQRVIAALLGAFVVAVTAWPTVAAMRAARRHRSALRAVGSPAALLACLSFDVRTTLAAMLRSFDYRLALRPRMPVA